MTMTKQLVHMGGMFLVGCLLMPVLAEARYHDPKTGRFLQRDPESPGQVRVQNGRVVVIKPSPPSINPLDLNSYLYVRNNSINFIDPYGLLPRGTKKWDDAKAKAGTLFQEGFEQAQGKCPPIPGKSPDESIDMAAEALADEVTDEEWGYKGLGLKFNKGHQENLERRLRQKYPDWPWARWQEIKENLE